MPCHPGQEQSQRGSRGMSDDVDHPMIEACADVSSPPDPFADPAAASQSGSTTHWRTPDQRLGISSSGDSHSTRPSLYNPFFFAPSSYNPAGLAPSSYNPVMGTMSVHHSDYGLPPGQLHLPTPPDSSPAWMGHAHGRHREDRRMRSRHSQVRQWLSGKRGVVGARDRDHGPNNRVAARLRQSESMEGARAPLQP